MFNKQKKEEKRQRKLMHEIKKKQRSMDKLEEDIKKMAKLTLKDGKLQRVDNNPAPQAPPMPLQQAPMPPQQAPMPPQQAPMPRPQQVPQPNPYPQEMPQYQQPMPPQAPPAPRGPEPSISLLITLDTGGALEVIVGQSVIDGFMKEVNEAINEQLSIQIGNQLINGRHIVSVAPQQ